jgi:hypothetical protein
VHSITFYAAKREPDDVVTGTHNVLESARPARSLGK